MESEKIDLEQVRALVKIASEADITELSVESPTLKVSIKKAPAGRLEVHAVSNPARTPAAPHAPTGRTAAARAEVFVPDHLKTITAPMVGTFYRAATPDAPPFVGEGDLVETGQTVCIIEAMKLFNEIQSEVNGRVTKVLVENGAPVEYGQPLFLIDPHTS
jgi:acetyl-CoA carboxylase biotin carboxyl carrier protein